MIFKKKTKRSRNNDKQSQSKVTESQKVVSTQKRPTAIATTPERPPKDVVNLWIADQVLDVVDVF